MSFLESISVPGKYLFYSFISLHFPACVQTYQCLITLPIFIKSYAHCEAATGESFGLDLIEWINVLVVPQHSYDHALPFSLPFLQQSERLCWSSAGTVSMLLGWRWNGGTRGTSSSLLNMQENKTRSRWGHTVLEERLAQNESWFVAFLQFFDTTISLSPSCSSTIFLASWWTTSLQPVAKVRVHLNSCLIHWLVGFIRLLTVSLSKLTQHAPCWET